MDRAGRWKRAAKQWRTFARGAVESQRQVTMRLRQAQAERDRYYTALHVITNAEVTPDFRGWAKAVAAAALNIEQEQTNG